MSHFHLPYYIHFLTYISYHVSSTHVFTQMESSPVFTFLWVYTFPIGIHGPAVIPMLFAFCVTAMETFGDVTATEHASRLLPSGPDHARRVQVRSCAVLTRVNLHMCTYDMYSLQCTKHLLYFLLLRVVSWVIRLERSLQVSNLYIYG